MYTIEEFDKEKTKVVKYIVYKKRTEKEVYRKFQGTIPENMLEDIIEYLKENGYIQDKEYIAKAVQEYMLLQTLSQKEIEYKLYAKGISRDDIEEYWNLHQEELQEYEIHSAKKIFQKKANIMEEKDIVQYLLKKGYTRENIHEAQESQE